MVVRTNAMSLKNKSFYWVGEPPTSNFCEGVILVNQIEEVPVGLGGDGVYFLLRHSADKPCVKSIF